MKAKKTNQTQPKKASESAKKKGANKDSIKPLKAASKKSAKKSKNSNQTQNNIKSHIKPPKLPKIPKSFQISIATKRSENSAMPKIFLTTNESAQYYESGYSCDNAILLKLDTHLVFITDARYTTEAKEHLKESVEIVESHNLLDSAIAILHKERIKEIVFDPRMLCVQDYQKLEAKLPKCRLVAMPNFHQLGRIIKTNEEIGLIKKSQELNKKAFKRFSKQVREGMYEHMLYALAKGTLENDGLYSLSFDPIVALNANAAKPHALPGQARLKKGDLLLLDAGIKYKRYCSDRTRSGYFGESGLDFTKNQHFANKKLQKIYDIVRKAQEHTIANIKSGMSGKQIDALARDVITQAGFGEYFSHSTGHGIGLDIHEQPFISTRSETIITDGMVFSIEPGIYIPGKYGVRIEDLVVIRNGRAEIL